MTLRTMLHQAARAALCHTPLRRVILPSWRFNMRAPHLCFLSECIERTRAVEGSIVEVGVAAGWTTLFLNDYMTACGIEKPYTCIDTFEGFRAEDVAHEVSARGKRAGDYTGQFTANSQRWFDTAMSMNGIRRVRSIRADAGAFDYATLGPIAFCLLDVDLYQPTALALPKLWAQLSPGGTIVVDDCVASRDRWDGAAQAYREFAERLGTPEDVVHGKLGVLRKRP